MILALDLLSAIMSNITGCMVYRTKSMSFFWLQKLLQNKRYVYYYEVVVHSNGAYRPVKQSKISHHLSLFVL